MHLSVAVFVSPDVAARPFASIRSVPTMLFLRERHEAKRGKRTCDYCFLAHF
jgi:hypothetical protein